MIYLRRMEFHGRSDGLLTVRSAVRHMKAAFVVPAEHLLLERGAVDGSNDYCCYWRSLQHIYL